MKFKLKICLFLIYVSISTMVMYMSKLTASKYLVEDQNIMDQYGNETLLAKSPPSLSKDLISKIKTFVLFIGRERSGSSIVGALMNAHPHMAIAHQYHIFKPWPSFIPDNWTTSFYNLLYRKSTTPFNGTSKVYSLSLNGSWQGKMNEYLSVIGDNGAGFILKQYYWKQKINFEEIT